MKDESRIVFVPRNNSAVKEFKISRIKLFSYSVIFLICFAIIGKMSMDFLVDFSQNSKINTLQRTNAVLQDRLLEAKSKIDSIHNQVRLIVERDEELRTVLGLSQLSSDVRDVGIGGSEFEYNQIDEVSGFEDDIGLREQLNRLSKLEREVKLELTSYNELMDVFNSKQDSLKYLPSLKPVLEGRKSSGFGMRKHTILKVKRHHDGIDLSATRGTPIYASADGIIQFVGNAGGYGRMIKIDHKYGFETRYGHMSKYVVRKGESVKRGQKIGEVGNTGLSTAPHVHYEVLYKGKALNPELYYFDDRILNTMVVQK